jgi:signal peptidase
MIRDAGVRERHIRAVHMRDSRGKTRRPNKAVGVPSWFWLAVIAWLIGVYLLVNFRLPRVQTGSYNIYLAQPLTWSTLALLGYLGWRFGLPSRPRGDFRLASMGMLSGFFQIALFVLAGLMLGFGHSPYSHQLLPLLGNMLYLGTMLVAFEISRAYLVGVFSLGDRTIAVVTTSLLLACLSIPVSKYTSVADAPSLFKFYGVTLLPTFSENLLASFLTLLGGPIASIAYRAMLLGFEWLSPVLPNIPWTVTAFVGTMAPAFGLIVIRNQIFQIPPSAVEDKDHERQLSSAWVVVTGISVALLWFNSGLFGVRPTLVSGVSMDPALIAGDIVITREVSAEEIVVGDIIRFRHHDTYILHRVVDVENESGRIYFITKGDANNVEDPPVLESQLEGKVILTVPKVGWLSIGLRNLLGWVKWDVG